MLPPGTWQQKYRHSQVTTLLYITTLLADHVTIKIVNGDE